MDENDAPIPHFSLYGEHGRDHFEDLVHCETIARRSSRYNWEIAPHRHPALCQVLLLAAGKVDLLLAGHRSSCTGPVLIITPAGAIHGFHFSHDVDGYVMTLSDKFVREFASDNVLAELLSQPQVFDLDPQTTSRLSAIAEQVILASSVGSMPDLLRRALAEAFIRVAAEAQADAIRAHYDTLVQRFQMLVQLHMREQRKLPFYAETLNCTERTLSRRVHKALGVAPAHYINHRLAVDATRLLRFTNASCNEVAEELGFADPSYFSRFYTRMTGRRPSTARGSDV